MKVLVPYDEELVTTVQSILGAETTVVRSSRDAASMLEQGGDAEVVASGRVPGDYIRGNTRLRLIQTLGAGVNGIDSEAVLERGDITVCNSHLNAPEVAEYAISLLLSAAKNIAMNDREMRKGDWTLSWGGPIFNIELRGSTCLLVGLGNVGVQIAKRLRCFDMRVIAVTRSGRSNQSNLVDKITCLEDMDEVIPEADFVILALPLTEDSVGMVDDDFLSLMKPSSILINISRGPIVQADALFDALKNQRIRGAALDVWWQYPSIEQRNNFYPSDKLPFHELDNLILSPHRAAYSENVMKGQIESSVQNILRFIRGEPLENIVDMKRGY
jgi:phosphoglycerate dehydrogenase-like enzyme